MSLDEVVFESRLSETERGREYWLFRPWVSDETRASVGEADVLVVPWEDFRPSKPALFPDGTSDFMLSVDEAPESISLSIAIDVDKYEEIALHSGAWRFPSLVCSAVILPLVLNILANNIDRAVFSTPQDAKVEISITVVAPRGKSLTAIYKGPAGQAIDQLTAMVNHYVDLHKDTHGDLRLKERGH